MGNWPRRTQSVAVDYDVAIPMRDGVVLRAEVFRPSRDGPVPAVVLRTPYDRHQGSMTGNQVNAVQLAAAGYAVVVQDVRGRFGSDGDFYPFRYEGSDGIDTIEWAADQPWSDGTVGTVGSSYLGFDQVLAAREQPDALKAWVPAFTTLDARNGWVFEQDAFCLGFNLSWTLSVMLSDPRTRNLAGVRDALSNWKSAIDRYPEDLTLVDQPEGFWFRDWHTKRDDSEYWGAISGSGVGLCEAPSLQVGGWFDLFNRGTFDLHSELNRGVAGEKHHLVVGPWDHSALPPGTGSGESDFGPEAGFDLSGAQRTWFDWLLRGESEPEWPAARVFLTGENRWESFNQWLPDAESAKFYFDANQQLTDVLGTEHTNHFTTDTGNPTPTAGGRLCCAPYLLPMGQRVQDDRAARPDVVRYRSGKSESSRALLGPVAADIWSTSDRDIADVHVTLVDIDEHDRSLYLADGIARKTVESGTPTLFTIDLGQIGHVLQPGHRIGVDIAGMSFPRFDLNPDAGLANRAILGGGSYHSCIRVG